MRTFLLAALLLTATTTYAQERTASGAMGAQMSWSALSTKVDAANIRTDAVNTRVDQIVLCGKKQMIYAPGTPGADGSGCVALQNLTKVIDCGKQGAIYSATTDQCIKASQPRWFSMGQAPTSGYNCSRYQCTPYPIAAPAGYVTCGANEGTVARICDTVGKRCARYGSATGSQYIPAGSCSTRDQENNNCSQGGMQTTTSTWYDLYACE